MPEQTPAPNPSIITSYSASCDLVPAAAITFAGGYTAKQPIIFTTQFGCSGSYVIDSSPLIGTNQTVEDAAAETKAKVEKGEKIVVPTSATANTDLKWVIAALDVMLTRDWSTSEARISITSSNPDPLGRLPLLPDLSIFRGGNRKQIGCEDEIRIYIGYVPSGTIIDASQLSQYPYSFKNLEGAVNNSSAPLKPVFWGFIDKVDHVGSALSGDRYIFSCRDRTRIFADTRIISIPSLQGSLSSGPVQGAGSQGLAKGDRAQILLDLANAVSNTLGEEAGSIDSWKPILPGLCFTRVTSVSSNSPPKVQEAPSDPQAWINTAALSIMDPLSRPRFHRWVERPPLTKGSESAILQVEDKSPLEIIEYLAKHEESPMDFYCSHVNGDFVFAPRILDFTGFDDPARNYRTYFYKGFPGDQSIPPSQAQRVIDIRAVSSSLATFNKFIVVDDTINGSQTSFLQNIRTGVYVLPWGLKGRVMPDGRTTLAPPPRAQIIHDGALDNYENPQFGALMVSLAASRILARDLDAVQITVLGDATFCPGEAIRVYNTALHDNNSYITIDPAAQQDCLNKVYDVKPEGLSPIKNDTDTIKNANPTSKDNSSKTIDEALNNNGGRAPTSITNFILPTYKIRSIQHTLTAVGSKPGWTTSVSATCDV